MPDDTPSPTLASPEAALAAVVAEVAPPPAKKVDLPPTPIFGKWDTLKIQVSDVGLARYLCLDTVGVLHHGARHANKHFGKTKVHVVERLINDIMRSENYQGKKSKAHKAVQDAFELVHQRSKDNPVQVLVTAIVNAAPREEVTRLRYGGINVPKSVDVAPLRRLNVAIRHLAQGACEASFKSPKPIAQCIADEILKAAKNDPQSFAVGKKDEVERVAKSAR
ncbi:MAG TPA: 30S ribosomal protein S7 [Candidatus Thermoplasmatota archaeon]|nr:30S ribosomal protein S7 [Candidatus Thermoplasmatota archaeon]